MKISGWGALGLVLGGMGLGYAWHWGADEQRGQRCRAYGGVLCPTESIIYAPNGQASIEKLDNNTFRVRAIDPTDFERIEGSTQDKEKSKDQGDRL